MATLQELQLKNESRGEEFSGAELPSQEGDRVPPFQPGVYRFRIPAADKLADAFVGLENVTVPDGQGGELQGQTRFAVRFNENCPLEVVQSPDHPQGSRNGQGFRWFCSNVEYKRGRDHTRRASTMDYLLTAVLGPEVKLAFGDNPRYAQRFLECAGKTFSATVTMQWYSNPKSDHIFALIPDQNGQTSVQRIEHVQGDGARYRERDIGTDASGLYPTTVEHALEVPDPGSGEVVGYTQILWAQNDLRNLRA